MQEIVLSLTNMNLNRFPFVRFQVPHSCEKQVFYVMFLFFFNFFNTINEPTEPAAAAMIIGSAKLAISTEKASETRIGKSKVNILFEPLESSDRGFSRMSILKRNKSDL